jgi:hypothetical protein
VEIYDPTKPSAEEEAQAEQARADMTEWELARERDKKVFEDSGLGS